jgi:hypothetical protein
MNVPYEQFTQVLDLGDVELRRLIRDTGDEPERLWAAWAIALRGSADTAALLDDATRHEPSPGVRAHLVTLLVAHGEREAALVLARRDPSTLVRESAWRCLARIASPTDDALNDALAATLVNDRDADVRAAILDGLGSNASPLLRERAITRLGDESSVVRLAAVDYLIARSDDGGSAESLLGHAPAEPDEQVFDAIVGACFAKLGVAHVVVKGAQWNVTAAVRLLAVLDRAKPAFVAGDLAPMFEQSTPAIDAALVGLDKKRAVDLPLGWLLAMALRSDTFECARIAAKLGTAQLDIADRDLVAQLIVSIERAYRAKCESTEADMPLESALAKWH